MLDAFHEQRTGLVEGWVTGCEEEGARVTPRLWLEQREGWAPFPEVESRERNRGRGPAVQFDGGTKHKGACSSTESEGEASSRLSVWEPPAFRG